ncbi:MAG: phosphoribosyltransferase family protein [Verrucomicrobiae bacterium]|nr:phosphoribosyltransferase family protein [Verrucomicrobiae bacterium]MCX7721483.1 phosphoribosyltransferase family protein [Verrucomicrobiae bacterium]MDW7979335.1 phosphoribosyltransferase family protein [Verrucomicrobiales bacterium]
MTFLSRKDAGIRLGESLRAQGVVAELVLGMPRGGVVVAGEVARILRLPLDIIVVRKIGHPWNREFAVGALAEGGVVVIDEQSLGPDKALRRELDLIVSEEKKRLHDYRRLFRRARPVERAGKAVLLVDDGLATGATAEAAVKALLAQQVRHVTVAVPVASTSAVARLRNAGADVVTLVTDPEFVAVGQYYLDFTQTGDEEVLSILRASEAEGR